MLRNTRVTGSLQLTEKLGRKVSFNPSTEQTHTPTHTHTHTSTSYFQKGFVVVDIHIRDNNNVTERDNSKKGLKTKNYGISTIYYMLIVQTLG